MNTHALYSASSLERLSICPPSARLSKDVFIPSGPAAERGTRIHKLAEQLLTGEPTPADCAKDELAMATQYSLFVEELLHDGDLYVEVDLTPALQIYNPNFGGTADAVIRHNHILEVIDLKTGSQHITPSENKQLLTYALGALDTVGWVGIKIVRLHIWQPRNIASVQYDIERMTEWTRELVAIGNRADDPFERPVPTKKHCYYCKGKVNCDAIRELAYQKAQDDFNDVNSHSQG